MSRHILPIGALLLFLLSAVSNGVLAQTRTDSMSVTPSSSPSVDPVPEPSSAQEASETPSSEVFLPRSMRPFYHVFAAFGLAWTLILGYVVSVRRRMDRLEAEVERLIR